MNSGGPNRRMRVDVMKLIENKFEVETDDYRNLIVKLHGPEGTPYAGGVWQVRVFLPDNYPFKPPNLHFDTRIFHPNVYEGWICLDVLHQKWTPLYNLVTIFETFLPLLLKNPLDLRADKAPNKYEQLVAKQVQHNANSNVVKLSEAGDTHGEMEDESVSDLSAGEDDE